MCLLQELEFYMCCEDSDDSSLNCRRACASELLYQQSQRLKNDLFGYTCGCLRIAKKQ